MRFSYKIEDLPEKNWGYHVTAYTEGRLRVETDAGVFLDADGILLVEFAVVLYKWLVKSQSTEHSELYYASMDFEEEPLFAAAYDVDSQMMMLESVWSDMNSVGVAIQDLDRAARQYISELGLELRERLAVDLPSILARTAEDDGLPR